MPAASTTARTPAGDDAGTLGGRLQHDARRSEVHADFVRDRRPTIGMRMMFFFASSTPFRMDSGTSPALPGRRRRGPRRHRRRRCTEAEAATALDDFRHAVDLDDALFERQFVGVDPGQLVSSSSELEAGFAGASAAT